MIRTILGGALAVAALIGPAPAAHAEETDPELCYGVWTTGSLESGAGPVCVPWPADVSCGVLETGLGSVKVFVLSCLPNPLG